LTDEGATVAAAAQRVEYALSNKYYDGVRAEMLEASYLAASKYVDMARQAEQMRLTANERATLIICNRSKRKR
jgi:hypothetical protein